MQRYKQIVTDLSSLAETIGAVGYAQAIGYASNRIVKALGGYPEREYGLGFRRVRGKGKGNVSR